MVLFTYMVEQKQIINTNRVRAKSTCLAELAHWSGCNVCITITHLCNILQYFAAVKRIIF